MASPSKQPLPENLRDRSAMQKLWGKYSNEPTLESMMLNGRAAFISERDAEQVLAILPDLTDKKVLELGAGIGRFTKHLVGMCGSGGCLHATDFIERFVHTNELENGGHDNVTFSVDDVTQLDFDDQSFDFIFTNWIFMYLTDEEVLDTVSKIMRWLKPAGSFHFRESCTESSNKKKSQNVAENPTYYRHISQYLNFLNAITVEQDNHIWRLNVSWTNSIEVYVTEYSNWRQVHLMVEKYPVKKNASTRTQITKETLLSLLGAETLKNQEKAAKRHETTRKLLNGEVSPMESYINQCLSNCDIPQRSCNVLSVGTLPQIAETSAYSLTQMLQGSHVFHLETSPYHYSALLDEANVLSNQQVRYLWSPRPDVSGGFCPMMENMFDVIFGCAVFSEYRNNVEAVLENIKKCLKSDGKILFLEPSLILSNGLVLPQQILKQAGFKRVDISVTTDDVNLSIENSLNRAGKVSQMSGEELEIREEWSTWFSQYPRWYLIQASLCEY